MFGDISEKFRTLDIQIIFAIFPPPPNFSLFSVVGGILFPYIKGSIFLSRYQSTYCIIIEHFTTVLNYQSCIGC